MFESQVHVVQPNASALDDCWCYIYLHVWTVHSKYK